MDIVLGLCLSAFLVFCVWVIRELYQVNQALDHYGNMLLDERTRHALQHAIDELRASVKLMARNFDDEAEFEMNRLRLMANNIQSRKNEFQAKLERALGQDKCWRD